MSLPKPDIHVRICEEAMQALEALAYVEQRNKAELAGQLLEEVLLGKVHTLTLAANRFNRLGLSGRGRE